MHTFADPLRRGVRVAGDEIAVVDGDTRLTFCEFERRCRKAAGLAEQLGVEPGERVAIWSDNSLPYLELYVGLPASGRVVVPLNTRHAEPELAYAMKDAGCKVLVTDRDPGGLADLVERVIMIPDEYDALVEAAPEAELGVGVTEDDIAGLFYTGGTTGASKGVMLTHRNLIANALNTIIGCGLDERDSWLVMAPMFHAAGSFPVLAMLWLGAPQVVTPFVPGQVLDLIQNEKITATLGVPTMVAAMAELQSTDPRDVSSLRHFSHGGSPIASDVVRRAHEQFPDAELVHLYGATETAPLVSFLRHEQQHLDTDMIRSCGQATVGVEIRISGPSDTAALAVGEVGEVLVRGNNVMKGYWNKEEQTAAVLVDGWYRTGDLGRLDERGYLFLVDRAKDMIVSGGENVYSTEVEEVLFQHPDVKEATVFGVPDDQWGEAVHAVVVPWDGRELDVDELTAFCRERIGGYKVPRSMQIRFEPLPVSGPGKVLKRQLRAPFWEGRDTQI